MLDNGHGVMEGFDVRGCEVERSKRKGFDVCERRQGRRVASRQPERLSLSIRLRVQCRSEEAEIIESEGFPSAEPTQYLGI